MTGQIIPARTDHIPFLVDNIREADRQEIWDWCMMDPQEALEKSLESSEFRSTGMVDGKVVAMFGIARVSLLSDVGRPWMIASRLLDRLNVAREFRKFDWRVVKAMLAIFPTIENYVGESNTRAIKWLKRLGFQFDAPEPAGLFGKPFMRFWMVR